MPDASDNCPADANADQSDADKDGVGDACEQLPSGNTPPTAGRDRGRAPALGRGVRQAARAPRLQAGDRVHPAQGRGRDPDRVDRRRAQGRDRGRLGGQRLRGGRPAGQAPAGAHQGRDVRDPPEARQAQRGQEDRDRHRRRRCSARPAPRPSAAARPGEGRRALGVDGRQGALPGDRRRDDGDREERDVRHHRPLRRHADRGRQGPRHGRGQGAQEAGRRARRRRVLRQGEAVRRAQGQAPIATDRSGSRLAIPTRGSLDAAVSAP